MKHCLPFQSPPLALTESDTNAEWEMEGVGSSMWLDLAAFLYSIRQSTVYFLFFSLFYVNHSPLVFHSEGTLSDGDVGASDPQAGGVSWVTGPLGHLITLAEGWWISPGSASHSAPTG